MKNIALYIILLLLCVSTWAQSIVINDAELKRCLVTEYPLLMNPDSTMDKASANNFNNQVVCKGYAIEDVSTLSEFTQAWEVYLEGAKLTDLSPVLNMQNLSKLVFLNCEIAVLPDLSPLTNLNYLDVESCGLQNFPTLNSSMITVILKNNIFETVNINKNYPELTQLLLTGNRINSIQGFEHTPMLKKLFLGGNQLTELPSLEALDSLEALHLWSNQLTEIQGLENKPNLTELTINNNQFETLPNLGSTKPTNYSITANRLTFEDLTPLLSWFNFAGNTSEYAKQANQGSAQSFTINPGQDWKWSLSFDTDVTSNYYLWYKDSSLIDSTDIGEFSVTNFTTTDEGVYYCEVKNTLIDSLTISVEPQTVTVNSIEELKKPIAFSPNGDGDYDELFIKFEGNTEIYDSRGNLIIELQTPATWDGTTSLGAQAPFGYYFIKVNGQHKLSVTLVR